MRCFGYHEQRTCDPWLEAEESRTAMIKLILVGNGMHSFRVIDSHTGGEPTRTIVEGGPDVTIDPATGRALESMADRLACMRTHYDRYRRAIVNEPRGSDVMVGALLVPPVDPSNLMGVIFFNNVGYLGMCGHGTMGVVETLRYLGKMKSGRAILETVAGNVEVELFEDHRVAVRNVASYREASQVPIALPGFPVLKADIAYGGNWFCLVKAPDASWLNRPCSELLEISQKILAEVRKSYPKVDHVELFGEPLDPKNDSRSFVLCPGGAYDRSPCGTGTSAKVACLAAEGELDPQQVWRQESIIGSVFEASYDWKDPARKIVVPTICSRAHVNGDVTILADPEDPFAWGI